MDKFDVFELLRAYLGAFLLFLDGCNGWLVTDYIYKMAYGGFL